MWLEKFEIEIGVCFGIFFPLNKNEKSLVDDFPRAGPPPARGLGRSQLGARVCQHGGREVATGPGLVPPDGKPERKRPRRCPASAAEAMVRFQSDWELTSLSLSVGEATHTVGMPKRDIEIVDCLLAGLATKS